MSLPFISIIIPTYNDWSRLSLCLDALARQSYPGERFEIIVVNNNPDDKVPDHYTIPANCSIIDESRPGSYAARNTALLIAKGEILGFTDSDCIPDTHWIEKGISYLTTDPKVDIVGGDIHLFRNSKRMKLGDLHDIAFAFPQEKYVTTYHFAATANMFAYKKVFDKAGPFDDKLKSGGDYEWGQRAHQHGFHIVFAPDAIVNHPTRSSFTAVIKKIIRISETGRMKYRSGSFFNTYYLKQFYNIFGIHIPLFKSYKQVKNLGKEKNFSFFQIVKLYLFLFVLYYIRNFASLFFSLKSKIGSQS